MAGFDITGAAGLLSPIVDRKLHQVLLSYDRAQLNPGFVDAKTKQAVVTPAGDKWLMSVQYASGGASSASYTVANTNMSSAGPGVAKFEIIPRRFFTKGYITGETIDRCTGLGGVVDAMKFVVEDTVRRHMRKLCVYSNGTGSGALAVTTAVHDSADYVDIAPAYARRFEKGDKIVFAAAETSGGLRSATSLEITGIDRSAGRLYLSGHPSATIGAQVGDYVFNEGDRNAVPVGQFAWVPGTAPDSTSFYGVDRTADLDRLAGMRMSAATLTYRQALLRAARIAAANGAKIDRARLSIEDYQGLCEESDDLKTISIDGANTTIGFKGVEVAGGPTGSFTVLPDESLPQGDGMVEDSSAWATLTADGSLARVNKKVDGLLFRHVAGSDAYEMEVVSQLVTVCERPGHVLHMTGLGT
jgi:hypothetical protein